MCMRMTKAEPMDLPQMMKRRAELMVGEWQRNCGVTDVVLHLEDHGRQCYDPFARPL